MALPETQQALTVLNKASSILLLVHPKASEDAFASMVAMYLALLETHPGAIDAVNPNHVPDHLQFLPGSSQVHESPKLQPDIIVDIAGPTEIADVRREKLNGGMRVHITLQEGTDIVKENLETHVRKLPYDAVVVFGLSDLEELEEIFTDHVDFFYNTPIINIDNKAHNEHFGTVNVVDITASSIAEITHEIISEIEHVAIEANLATALYAGIVAATESFQKPSTSPHAFELAAELMNKDADKEAVIQHLVKTKPLHLLKLSGRVYARLRYDEYGQLFWSLLTPRDFQESDSTPNDIGLVMRELTNNISGFNAAFILYENPQHQYIAYMTLGKGLAKRRKEIQEELHATKINGALELHIDANNLEQAEETALDAIRKILPNL